MLSTITPSFGPNHYGSSGSNRKNESQIVTQGLVTFNVGSGERWLKQRMDDPNPKRFATNFAFNNDAYGAVHMQQFQLMLADPERAKQDMIKSLGMFVPDSSIIEPLATFNGFDPQKRSRQEIEKRLQPIGFAASSHTYGEMSQVKSGIAAIVRGSISTQNTGISMFFPGQLLKWMAYPMRDTPEDKAELKRFMDERHRVGAITSSQPANRFAPRIEPFDYARDSRHYLQSVIRNALDAASASTAAAAELFNFAVLENPALQANKTHEQLLAMRAIRSAYLTYAVLDAAFTNGITNVQVDALADALTTGKPVANLAAAEVVRRLRILFGMDPFPTVARVTADTNSKIARQIPKLAEDMHFVAIDTIMQAGSKVVAQSIGFSKPGGRADIVV